MRAPTAESCRSSLETTFESILGSLSNSRANISLSRKVEVRGDSEVA